MSMANDPIATISEQIRVSVNRNTDFTTCPICLAGIDTESLHKEPYIAELPGSPAVTGMIRRVGHTERPDGNWDTWSVLDYL